jgi:predicted site-specific integrase-resolvase
MWKTTGQVAAKNFVTNQTVINWIKLGKYDKVERTRGGHYRIWEPSGSQRVILYARVSSAKQKSSIATQERILRSKYPSAEFKFDIGSGFNFKRRKFRAILEQILCGNPVKIVVASRDRLSRSGLELLEQICKLFGSEIEEIEPLDQNLSATRDAFGIEYLIAYITSFCNSNSGRRSASRRTTNN